MPGYAVFAVDALEAEEDAGKTILSSLPFIKVECMPAGELPRICLPQRQVLSS